MSDATLCEACGEPITEEHEWRAETEGGVRRRKDGSYDYHTEGYDYYHRDCWPGLKR